jgi:WD40 repeat protein
MAQRCTGRVVFLLLCIGASNASGTLPPNGGPGKLSARQRPRTVSQRKVVLSGHTKAVNMLAFAPNRRILATGSDDNTLKLWDASSGLLLTTLTGHEGNIYDLKFSPDGKTLGSLSDDQKPRLWNTLTGESKATLLGHNKRIYNFEFSPDGQLIVTGSGDGTAKLWDAETGKLRATLKVTEYSNRWKQFFSGDPEALFIFPRGHFSPDGQKVLTISGDRTPKLWDVATEQLRASLDHESGAMQAVFSPDGRWVATTSSNDYVRLWETSTGQLKQLWAGHRNTIYDLSFSPDSRTLLTGSRDRKATLWEVTTGKLKYQFGGFDGRVPRVAFSPEGEFLAAKGGYDNHVVKLWSASTGKLLFALPLPGRKDDIEEIAFSPDGLTLMTSSDKTVLLWNTRTGELLATLEDARKPAVFSADGNHVVTRGRDNNAILWAVPSR